MPIVWPTVMIVVGLSAWFGAARMAARAWPAMGAGLALLLAGAGLCWVIGGSKPGPFPAGLMGVLCAFVLLIAAMAVVAGVALRLLYEWRRPVQGPPPARPGWWSVAPIGLLAGLGVVLSAME